MSKEGVFPRRIEALARKALEKHHSHFDVILDGLAGADVVVEVAKGLYAEGTIAAAALALAIADKEGMTLGYISAAYYTSLLNSSPLHTDFYGFEDSTELLSASELMVMSDLSMVGAGTAHIIDGYLSHRWAQGQQTIICGYNVPDNISHTGETIDGYSGYPLLSSRIHRTCRYWSPEFFKKTKVK